MNIFNPKQKFQTWLFPMQFACFDCRKVYKRTIDFDGYEEVQICPQCAEEMFLMGRAFRAPKQNNIKQWKKAELLIKNGFVFSNNALCYYKPRLVLNSLKDAENYTEGRKIKLIPKKRKKILFKKQR